MKKLLLKKFYGWISNDPHIWWVWSFKNVEWVEIRTNSWAVTLSKWTHSYQLLTSSSDIVRGYLYYDSTKYLRLHNSWKITNIFKNDIDNGNIVTDLDWVAYNMWSLTTPTWPFWFIITSWKLYKWNYNTSDFSLGIYNDSGSWIVNEPSFNATWTWTIWTWWVFSWWNAVHTAWSADWLTQTLTTTNGTTYRFEIVCWTITADSCQFRLWWVNQYTFTSADSWKTKVLFYTASWTSTSLEFAPFSWFVWSFQFVNWQTYTMTSQDYNFNANAPIITLSNIIYIWNGNKITWIDTTWWVWSITTALTIDLDYTIKGITRIWDQFFVYATNWQTSRQYLWNWISNTTNLVITWIDKNIVNVANFQNQDYVVTKSTYSNKTWLWVVQWYQLQLLYTNEENNNPDNERIFFNSWYTNAIETLWNRLAIPWNYWIMTYWQHTPWLPYSLVKEYPHLIWDITAMSYNEWNNGRLTFSWYWTFEWTSWVWEILIQPSQWYASRSDLSWFLEYSISWTSVSNIKTLNKIIIGKKTPTNTRINIYTKNTDRATKYANIMYNYTTIPTIWAIYTSWATTFTIYDVTDVWNTCILHCTYTWSNISWWTLTKTSWTWDNTFYTDRVRYDYKLIWTTNSDKRKYACVKSEEFAEIDIWIELLTSSSSVTPELNNIYIYYDEKEDE